MLRLLLLTNDNEVEMGEGEECVVAGMSYRRRLAKGGICLTSLPVRCTL